MLSGYKVQRQDSLRKQVVKGAAWMTLEMAGVQATLFAVFVAMARFVEPRDFGFISISFLAVQTLQMLILYNVDTVAARKQQATDLEYTTAFWIANACSCAAFIGLLVFSKWVEKIFSAPGLAPVFQAMSIIILFMGLGRVHETWMIRNFQFKALALRGLVGAVASAVVGITMAVHGYGVMALVGQQVTNAVVTMLLLWITCPWRPSFNFSMPAAVEIGVFVRSIMPNSLLYTANQNIDTFLIAVFLGPVSAGVFNVGKRLRLMLQLVIGVPINNISLPALAEIQTDPTRLHRGLLSLLTLICAICSPVFFGVSAVSHELVKVVLGAKWMASAPVLELLSFSGLAITLIAYTSSIFILKDRQSWSLYVSLVYFVLAMVAFMVCFAMRVDSLALPFVLPYAFAFVLAAFLVSKCVTLSLRDWVGAMLPGIGSAIIMFLSVKIAAYYLQCMYPLQGAYDLQSTLLQSKYVQGISDLQGAGDFHGVSDLVRLLLLCVLGAVVYAAVLWVFWRSTAMMIIEMARNMFHR